MVNLTQCAVCGRVIPATEEGCAYCERERDPSAERPYLALSIRLLLGLFALDLVVTAAWSLLSLVELFGGESVSPWPALPGLFRLCLSIAALLGLAGSRRWGWYLGLAFLGVELLGALLLRVGVLWVPIWSGPLLAPLWTILFVLVLARPDVHARFDQQVADRREVDDLLDNLESPRRTH